MAKTFTREVRRGNRWDPTVERQTILDNSNGRCVYCGEPGALASGNLQCDHIAAKGSTTACNGQANCSKCNQAKSDLDNVAAREPFAAIDHTDPIAVGRAHIEAVALRIAFKAECVKLRVEMNDRLALLVGTKRLAGKTLAAIRATIKRTHNLRTAKAAIAQWRRAGRR